MEYKKLGLTDLKISRIGFGCWAIGGYGYGNVNDDESIKAIRTALDMGVNFFDTADIYGFGHSEKILAKALGSERNKVITATKFGLSRDKNGNIYKDCSPQRIRKKLEHSLKRLKIDSIPIYQIHWHDGKTPLASIIEVLEKFREEGKIRHIGCCNFSTKLLFEINKTGRIELLQCEHNILQDLNLDVIKYAEKFKVSIVTYNVLLRGFFYGKYNFASKFDDKDTRKKDKNFYGETLKSNLAILEKLKQIGIKYNKSTGQIAIRMVLDNPGITSAIIGAKTKEQVQENVLALDFNIQKEDIEYINALKGINSHP